MAADLWRPVFTAWLYTTCKHDEELNMCWIQVKGTGSCSQHQHFTLSLLAEGESLKLLTHEPDYSDGSAMTNSLVGTAPFAWDH